MTLTDTADDRCSRLIAILTNSGNCRESETAMSRGAVIVGRFAASCHIVFCPVAVDLRETFISVDQTDGSGVAEWISGII